VRISHWALPILVLLAAALGIGGARLLAAPSFTRDFAAASPRRVETVRFVVRGLRCVDTARRVAAQLEDVPGVLRCVAYAARNEAQVTYDAAVTDPRALRAAIEGPVVDEASGQILFHQFEVLSLDGASIR
jgi:copper chaperone CopZ